LISIVFGGALLIGSVTHAAWPKSLPEAALTLISVVALMGCYAFGVCLSCRSFERAKHIAYLAPEAVSGSNGSRAAELLRCSDRPDLPPEEMLRAGSGVTLAHSEQLVRPLPSAEEHVCNIEVFPMRVK
jgi:hypothetical protein